MNQTIRSGLVVAGLLFPGTAVLGTHVAGMSVKAPQAGCSALQSQEAKTVLEEVLTGSQIACILASEFDSSSAVAEACKIDSKLVPLVESLLAQKRAARRAAACAPDSGK